MNGLFNRLFNTSKVNKSYNRDEINIHFDSYSIEHEVATFRVSGEYQGDKINEKVNVTRNIVNSLQDGLLTEHEYLNVICDIKEHCNDNVEYKEMLKELAIKQYKEKKIEFETFKMKLDLTGTATPNQTKVTTLYDRTGALYTIRSTTHHLNSKEF